MAGVSTKAIKSKIKSMQSTRQITKAMELVASSKLRSAQDTALKNRVFFGTLFDAMNEIASSVPSFTTAYQQPNVAAKPLYLVIAGDRGLAGGYNNNVFKYAVSVLPPDAVIIPIGKKSLEYFRRNNWDIAMDEFGEVASMSASKCYTLAKLIADEFLDGKYCSVSIVYTEIVSLLSQTPRYKSMLPLSFRTMENAAQKDMSFEGSPEEVFDAIVPEYLGGVIYCAVKEGYASEQAARRTAMNAASKNADEMIAKLDLAFNRARQAAITQEITEIVAGSES